MGVYSKLNEARLKFHAMPLKKSGYNSFAKYRYFELTDFLVPALQICNEVGICCTISFTGNDATMRIIDLDDGSTIILNTPIADAATKGALPIQTLGSLHTYCRRYLWMLALEIVEHDAIDAMVGNVEPADVGGLASDKLEFIEALMEQTGTDPAAMCKHYKVAKIADMSAAQYEAAIKVLGKKAMKQ